MVTESSAQAEGEISADFAAAFAESAQTNEPQHDAGSQGQGSNESTAPAEESVPVPTGERGADIIADDHANTNASLSEGQSDIDIWASAPDPLRAAYQELQAKYETDLKRQNNRVSGLQKQLDAIQRQQREQTKTEPEPDPIALLNSDDVKRVREDYGEIANPLLEVIQPLVDKINRLEGTARNSEEARAAQAELEAETVLIEAHPDWKQVLAQNEDTFVDWLADQPRHVNEAFARNVERLTDPAEAIDVIGRFKQHLAIINDPQTQAIGAKRERQLAAATSVRTQAPSVSSQEPDDFAAGFAASSRA